MTVKSKSQCAGIDICDTRYVMREWLWRSAFILFITLGTGTGSIIFAGGAWKKDVETKIETLSNKVEQLQEINRDLDTIKIMIRGTK